MYVSMKNMLEKAKNENEIDPLLLIPVFIHDFLCIHPFNDGNGRMSRLLTTMLLYQSGYMAGKDISFEKRVVSTQEASDIFEKVYIFRK